MKRLPEDELKDELHQLSGEDPKDIENSAHDTTSTFPAEVTPHAADSWPPVIRLVMESDARDELVAVASMLRTSRSKTMNFILPGLGKVRCEVGWVSCDSNRIQEVDLIFVKVRSKTMPFVPEPGATLRVSFDDSKVLADVVCLCAPQTIYPGVDLLVFMPHNHVAMEKTGKLQEGVPSVVSGEPSTHVVDGEPVSGKERPMEKSAVSKALDFDQIRKD